MSAIVRIDIRQCIGLRRSTVSRVQLALNVSDVDAAVDFYSKLFGTPPAKRRPGYANFAVETPPLKLVLIENPDAAGTLNHLGVEVATSDEVTAATDRLRGEGLDTATEDSVTCCYAVQDKVWVSDPDQAAWEIYTVLADADRLAPSAGDENEPAGCCGSGAPVETAAAVGCC
jgi:catechol 2,3-dioxygenase-like lactoylglutathione lyase family enzyme